MLSLWPHFLNDRHASDINLGWSTVRLTSPAAVNTVCVWSTLAAFLPAQFGSVVHPRRRPPSWLNWWRSCWGCGPGRKPPSPSACSSWPWLGWWRGSRCGSPCGSEQTGQTWEDTESIWRWWRRKRLTGILKVLFLFDVVKNTPQLHMFVWISSSWLVASSWCCLSL